MELTIEKPLGDSVWIGHGVLPLTEDRGVEVELMVKHDEVNHVAQLHLDEARPTLVEGKPVLKYTMARVNGVEALREGQKLNFSKFFCNH